MGSLMAPRLGQAGHDVVVWNRTPEKAHCLTDTGVHVADTAADAAHGVSVMITMLANGPVVEEVLFGQGVAEALPPGACVIDMSSIPPAMARDHGQRLASRGIDYIDAPVSGGTVGAAAGTLAIMAGAEASVFERWRWVFEALGRATHVGPNGCGQLTKLCNQVIVAVTIGAVSEALLLGQAGGANPVAVREALSGGFADSRILREHGQRMLDRNWVPGGTAGHQVKDLNAIAGIASELGVVLPMMDKIRELFQTLIDEGGAELDHSALLTQLEKLNPPHRVGENHS